MSTPNKKVTQEQRLIIEHSNSHALVKAVPGSGKTTTLVKRVQHLLKRGVRPNQILVLMYNKAAQLSFSEKLNLTLKGEYALPPIRTFHSLAYKVVQNAERNGTVSHKKLLTPDMPDYKNIINQAYRFGYGCEDNFIEQSAIEDLELFIACCRAEGVAPDEVAADPIFAETPKEHIRAYQRFCELLQEQRFRTYDSMLAEAKEVITEHPQKYQQIKHVIVDEYQDVNLIQHQIIQRIAGNHATVMAVGDINQSIYQWRGSRPDFINGIFEQQFKPATVFYLSCTFRFGHQLSLIANLLIDKNKHKTTKLCISHPEQTPQTEIVIHSGLCLSELSSLLNHGNSATAILARTNAHLAEAELALRLRQITYTYPDDKSDGGRNTERTTLFKRKEICLLMAAFLLCIDGNFTRLSRHPDRRQIIADFLWGIGITWATGQLKQVQTQLLNESADVWQLLISALQNGRKHRLRLSDLMVLKDAANENDLAAEVYQKIAMAGLTESVGLDTGIRRDSNDQRRGVFRIKAFLQTSQITALEFLSAVLNPQKTHSDLSPVTLTTFHTAKGLEWDNVIIIGLDDAEFPPSSPQDKHSHFDTKSVIDDDTLEEERRLFYVAITRAKQNLHLLVPDDERLAQWLDKGWNTTPKKDPVASRFVYELGLTECKKVSQAIYAGTADKMNSFSNKLPRQYLSELRRLR